MGGTSRCHSTEARDRARWSKSACAGWESRSPVVVGEAVAPAAAAGSRMSEWSEMARSLSVATDNRQNALARNVVNRRVRQRRRWATSPTTPRRQKQAMLLVPVLHIGIQTSPARVSYDTRVWLHERALGGQENRRHRRIAMKRDQSIDMLCL